MYRDTPHALAQVNDSAPQDNWQSCLNTTERPRITLRVGAYRKYSASTAALVLESSPPMTTSPSRSSFLTVSSACANCPQEGVHCEKLGSPVLSVLQATAYCVVVLVAAFAEHSGGSSLISISASETSTFISALGVHWLQTAACGYSSRSWGQLRLFAPPNGKPELYNDSEAPRCSESGETMP
jgi:hypothetical protein